MRCLVLIFSAMLLAGPAARAQQLDHVTLRYGFVATGLDTLWTYGRARGFFRAQGIDLDLREGKGSAVTAQTVAAGTDDFGTDIDGGTFLTLAAKGLPAVAVMAIASKSPLVILSPAASPIASPAQLVGKKIAITAGDGPSALLPALLQFNHVDPASLTEINMQAGPKLTSLLTGRVDGVATNVVIKANLEARGPQLHALMYADFGVATPGLFVITSRAMLNRNPGLVQRFVTAVQQSMAATMADPAAAAASFHQDYPNYDAAIALGETRLTIGLFRSPDTEGKPLGTISMAEVQSGARILQQFGSYPAGVDPAGFVTNQFIPPHP